LDFYISYAQSDRAWAEWVAWTLEEAGYSVIVASRDLKPGENIFLNLDSALSGARQGIAILSSAYLESKWATSEWAAFMARDPHGQRGTLHLIRIEAIEVPGLLGALVYIDLVGKDEREARETLLSGLRSGRQKPVSPPFFPSARHESVTSQPLSFPGESTAGDPPELIPYIGAFRPDHEDPDRSAFVMMQFRDTRPYGTLLSAIKDSLAAYGIRAVRADDIAYADVLMTNVRTYMHGCGFGIAVFERIESEIHNRMLRSDMVDSLYVEFDAADAKRTIKQALERWLRQRNLISRA
jgi:hypothetical protein